ncbi:MAG: AzlC family ABC transporter permease [Pseudomonadota bacterium]
MNRSPGSPLVWVARGASHALDLPALVLMAAQVGFAALAREVGFSLLETLALTFFVWALPSQVVFVGLVGAGASAAATALAVTLSAMRFMPMVMSWMPMVRTPSTPRWALYLSSWFVAITAWIFAMAHLPALERSVRLPFFMGFAVTLSLLNALIVVIAYEAIGAMPDLMAAVLVFLTPVYFLLALYRAGRDVTDKLAIGAGLVLGATFSVLVPEADLLLAGLVGGVFAYGVGRALSQRGADLG